MFFAKYRDQWQETAELRETLAETARQAELADRERSLLKRNIGLPETVDAEGIAQAFKRTVEQYGAGLEEELLTYEAMLKHLDQASRSLSSRVADLTEHVRELSSELARSEETHQAQLAAVQQSLDAVLQDLAGERAEFTEDRARLTEMTEEVADKLEDERQHRYDEMASFNAKLLKLRDGLEDLKRTNKQLRERLIEAGPDVALADGYVTWVSQGLKTAWIDLGRADGLKSQMTFSVYPANRCEIVLGEPKGSIQVTRLVNEHVAEARIVDEQPSDPILPGDLIHSPVWNPGRRDGFALAGRINFDGDGESDRERLHRLLAIHGGKIDAELLPDGSMTGEIQPDTLYLVVGEPPGTGSDSSKPAEAFQRFVDQGLQKGLKRLTVSELLEQMGWRPGVSVEVAGIGR
jgi:hypothetical protein